MKPVIGNRLLVLVVALAMTAAVAAGLLVLGTPAHQRALGLDRHRVGDLEVLAGAIDDAWRRQHAMPATLDALVGVPDLRRFRTDPATGVAYEYRVSGPGSYRLCAVFAAASEPAASAGGPMALDRWSHPAGHHCFERSPDPAPANATP
jgi:hypothetical protein